MRKSHAGPTARARTTAAVRAILALLLLFPAMAYAQLPMFGTVKWYSEAKGFGFIVPDDGSADIFVSSKVINASGIRSLQEGQRVSFDITTGPKGAQAASVTTVAVGDENSDQPPPPPPAVSQAPAPQS